MTPLSPLPHFLSYLLSLLFLEAKSLWDPASWSPTAAPRLVPPMCCNPSYLYLYFFWRLHCCGTQPAGAQQWHRSWSSLCVAAPPTSILLSFLGLHAIPYTAYGHIPTACICHVNGHDLYCKLELLEHRWYSTGINTAVNSTVWLLRSSTSPASNITSSSPVTCK